MNDIATASSRQAPVVGDTHRVEQDMAAFIEAYDKADSASESERGAHLALAAFDEAMATLPALRKTLGEVSRPATRKEIVREFTLLLASKPSEWDRNASDGDTTRSSMREMWTQLFAEEIGAMNPSSGGLRLAGQRLRRARSDSDFANRRLPPICDVVQAIKDAEATFVRVNWRLDDLPALRARLQQTVDHEAALQAQRAERHHQINSHQSASSDSARLGGSLSAMED